MVDPADSPFANECMINQAVAETLLTFLITSHINDNLWKVNTHNFILHWQKEVLLCNQKSGTALDHAQLLV